jgi:hypothetical protein
VLVTLVLNELITWFSTAFGSRALDLDTFDVDVERMVEMRFILEKSMGKLLLA